AEDGIRDRNVTGVQTCALPICEVYAAPFAVRLFEKNGDTPEDVDTMVEPDISVVCDHGKLDSHGCKGAPDLVVEVLSPSTQRHRSEERRVGKERRSRWTSEHSE